LLLSLDSVEEDWHTVDISTLVIYMYRRGLPPSCVGAVADFERLGREATLRNQQSKDFLTRVTPGLPLVPVDWLERKAKELKIKASFVERRSEYFGGLAFHSPIDVVWARVISEYNGHLKTIKELHQYALDAISGEPYARSELERLYGQKKRDAKPPSRRESGIAETKSATLAENLAEKSLDVGIRDNTGATKANVDAKKTAKRKLTGDAHGIEDKESAQLFEKGEGNGGGGAGSAQISDNGSGRAGEADADADVSGTSAKRPRVSSDAKLPVDLFPVARPTDDTGTVTRDGAAPLIPISNSNLSTLGASIAQAPASPNSQVTQMAKSTKKIDQRVDQRVVSDGPLDIHSADEENGEAKKDVGVGKRPAKIGMKEAMGNIWAMEGDWLCITTNGERNSKGEAIMGRGIALEVATKFPACRRVLGAKLASGGNHVFGLGVYGTKTLVSFPTKHEWRHKSDFKLIRQSCVELLQMWRTDHENTGVMKRVLLPQPGCANGGLKYESDVRPILEEYFTASVAVANHFIVCCPTAPPASGLQRTTVTSSSSTPSPSLSRLHSGSTSSAASPPLAPIFVGSRLRPASANTKPESAVKMPIKSAAPPTSATPLAKFLHAPKSSTGARPAQPKSASANASVSHAPVKSAPIVAKHVAPHVAKHAAVTSATLSVEPAPSASTSVSRVVTTPATKPRPRMVVMPKASEMPVNPSLGLSNPTASKSPAKTSRVVAKPATQKKSLP
jgi:hypothetical protein